MNSACQIAVHQDNWSGVIHDVYCESCNLVLWEEKQGQPQLTLDGYKEIVRCHTKPLIEDIDQSRLCALMP